MGKILLPFLQVILPHRVCPFSWESNNYTSIQKFDVGKINFLKYSYAEKGCIYFNKNTVNSNIQMLWKFNNSYLK